MRGILDNVFVLLSQRSARSREIRGVAAVGESRGLRWKVNFQRVSCAKTLFTGIASLIVDRYRATSTSIVFWIEILDGT